jgi:hypothetical protein
MRASIFSLLHVREHSKPQCSDSIGWLEAREQARHCNREQTARLGGCNSCSIEGLNAMNGIIYIIGLIVVIAAVLSFFGLR